MLPFKLLALELVFGLGHDNKILLIGPTAEPHEPPVVPAEYPRVTKQESARRVAAWKVKVRAAVLSQGFAPRRLGWRVRGQLLGRIKKQATH